MDESFFNKYNRYIATYRFSVINCHIYFRNKERIVLKKLSGVKTPHYKNTAASTPVRMSVPSVVRIPMVMHIGAPAIPAVKVGDYVKVGQIVGQAGGFVSAPIHSGVSGTVKKIEQMLSSAGTYMTSVVIEPDGLQAEYEGLAPVNVDSLESLLEAVRNSGVVGLGGAGFPASVKLAVKNPDNVDYLIINGAECEPYITSDTQTMLNDSEGIMFAVSLIRKYIHFKNVIFGIEDNKPQCIELFKKLTAGEKGISVMALPASYPQGGEKLLIYNTTGRIVPEGKLPLDVGAIVMNCTTLSAIAKYIRTGMPLVEKCVTVDGSAIKEPKNVIAPIGTPINQLIEFCGGLKSPAGKILMGGPMMGIAMYDAEYPILKNTNAIIVLNEKDAMPPKTTSCIRCGRCIDTCPLKLMPMEIERAYNLKRGDLLEAYKVNLCMECGCCAYACPAKRPLVQVNKLAKIALRQYQAEKKKTEGDK